MRPKISISINPSYLCNFRCGFCYLTKEQLKDKTKVSIERLKEVFAEILKEYELDQVDIYGGEVLLLPEDYLSDIVTMAYQAGAENVNLVTNLSLQSPVLEWDDISIAVSYDFTAREKSDLVFTNMLALTRPFSVLVLLTPEVLNITPAEFISTFNLFSNLTSVEIKPYSANQANQLNVTDLQFSEYVESILRSDIPRNFRLTNELYLKKAYTNQRNAFSDDHVYITPNGHLAVLEFDENGNEFFLELSSLYQFKEWTSLERNRVLANTFCNTCQYKGRCLSEHLRVVDKDPSVYSCNGHFLLLKNMEWRLDLHDDDTEL
jgi:hypothetical protein